MQKLLANDNSMPLGLSALSVALLSLAGLLGVRMRRGVQSAADLAMAHGADMSIPMAQASVDNILELKAQQSSGNAHRKDDFMSGGWWQPSSQNLRPLTALYVLFDPLDFSEKASAQSPHREAELKHGRVAMLAAFGFPIAEHFHPLFGGNIDVPSYIAFQQTPLQTFWPLTVLYIGIVEIFSVFTFQSPFEGNWWTLKEDRIPGDYQWDPLDLYPSDPKERLELQTKELNNGRLAMIAIAGMVAQELATGNKLF